MANTVDIDIIKLSKPLSYKMWLQNVTNVYASEDQSTKDYNEYVTDWYNTKNKLSNTHKSDVKEMYISLLKDISLNYTTVEEKRFLLNIDFDNPRDLDIIIPFYSRKLKQIAQYYSRKREDIVQSSFRNTLKGSDFGVEVSVKSYILNLLSDESFTSQFNIAKPDIAKISRKIVIESQELFETQQAEYDLGTQVVNQHAPRPNPKCPDGWEHWMPGQEGYTGHWMCGKEHDEHMLANVEDIDPLLFLDMTKVVINDLKRCETALGTNDCVDPAKTRVSQSNDRIGVNIELTDWETLPLSSFVGGEKTYDNLIYHQQKNLITKYMGTRFHYLSTGTDKTDYTTGVLFEPDNPHRNILNRYHPGHLSVSPNTEYKTEKEIGGFFVPSKSGMLTFASYNPSFEVDVSKLEPNTIYAYPDPTVYGSGRGLSQFDQESPIKHTENVKWAKYDRSNHHAVGDVVDHEILPKFNAYQSREESTEYHPSGLSKRHDKVDFWTGGIQHIWTNEDVYPTKPLAPLPIEDRLGDLLISDQTMHEWKTDIFGNEFGLYKEAHAKRATQGQLDGNLVLDKPNTTTKIATMATDWFDIPGTTFYGTSVAIDGLYLLTMFDRFSIVNPVTQNFYLNKNTASIPATDEAASWFLDTGGTIYQDKNTAHTTGFVSAEKHESFTVDVVLQSDNSDDDRISVIGAFKYIPNNAPDGKGVTKNYDRINWLKFHASHGGWNSGTSGWGATLFVDDTYHDILNQPIPHGPQPLSWNGAVPYQNGWSGKTIRVRVQKKGSMIMAQCSQWGNSSALHLDDHVLLPETEMQVDLSTGKVRSVTDGASRITPDTPWNPSTPLVNVFNEPDTSYGIASHSQADSKYYDMHIWIDDTKYNTVYHSGLNGLSADKSISTRSDMTGTLFMRNIYSTVIDPVSSALSAVFLKYYDDPKVMDQINHNIIDFDLIGDVLFIKTPHYLIIEKYKFNFDTEQFVSILSRRVNLSLYQSSIQNIAPLTYEAGGAPGGTY